MACRSRPVRSATCAFGRAVEADVGFAVGAQRGRPIGLAELVDGGHGAGIDRPADRVLHPPPPRPVAAVAPAGGVQRRQVVHQRVGGAGPVHGDQQIGPPRGRDLGDRRVQDGDVVGGGERAGRPGPQHHREVVPDVGTPRGQGMEPEALEVGFGAVLGRGRRDHRGIQPEHRHRPTRLPATVRIRLTRIRLGGAGQRMTQLGPSGPDRGQPAMPVGDRVPRPSAGPGERPRQPTRR